MKEIFLAATGLGGTGCRIQEKTSSVSSRKQTQALATHTQVQRKLSMTRVVEEFLDSSQRINNKTQQVLVKNADSGTNHLE